MYTEEISDSHMENRYLYTRERLMELYMELYI